MALSTTILERGSFDDVARAALRATEKVFREGGSSTTPNPPMASTEDRPLRVKNFLVEEQEDLTRPESDALQKLTLPTPAPTQPTLGSGRLTPIILDEGKYVILDK